MFPSKPMQPSWPPSVPLSRLAESQVLGMAGFFFPWWVCPGEGECWQSGNADYTRDGCSWGSVASFSCPPGPLPPWSLCSLHVIFCLCLCHAHTLGAALPPRKDSQDWLAQILSIQDPLSVSCSMTPSPIQQPFIHSLHHSFKRLSETCSRPGTMPGMGVQRQVRSRLCF